MSSAGTEDRFEDAPVGIRLKVSGLWIAMLFLFAYGDVFSFFQEGQIAEVVDGKVGGFEITDAFLVAISIYVAIGSVMIFLTLVLKPAVNRWINIVLPGLYVVSIVASAIGEDAYFVLLSVLESALLGTIVWYAWRWPRLTR
jgi:Family of unknown function (DUF6326)